MSGSINTENVNNKQTNINKIVISYDKEFNEIIQLGKKMGFTSTDLENNPCILLHIFYSWLDIIK